MFLVQIFLPLYDNDGQLFSQAVFEALRVSLVERFHGLTAYSRAPATGLWQEGGGKGDTVRDDLVIYEVMTEALDRAWWHDQRKVLERMFRQETIIIRAQQVDLL